MAIDYSKYKKFATERQLQIIHAISLEGSQSKAAKSLGITPRSLERSLKSLKETASKQGYCEQFDYPAPDGFEVSTVRIAANGSYVPSFRQSKTPTADIIDAFTRKIKPLKLPKPPKTDSDLLNLYTISDYHLGMLSWARECGKDWDLDIASELLETAFLELIESSPNSETCLINILGDFFHTDGILPVTPTSKHVLDSDTRYYKLVERGVVLLRRVIEQSLKSHKYVKILVAEGNHDQNTAPIVQILLSHLYQQDNRVEVFCNPRLYYHYVFGNSMLCFHHGHKRKKGSDLTKVFSSDPFFRRDWGSCRYAYGHSGHLHHERVEDGGCLWTQHPTLAARDAYASRGGWSSQRACIAFTYHKEFGERSCVYVRPEMFDGQ